MNAGLLFVSDEIILTEDMSSGPLLDLNKNQYDILNIYPGQEGHKAKWWDQDNDFFERGTQGTTDGYRYISERKGVHLTII